jgi:hypothetical protein
MSQAPGDFDLRELGWGVIPVGAIVGAVLALTFLVTRGIATDLSLALAAMVGFAVIGAGAAGLLLAWSRISNKFIALLLVSLGLIVLLLSAIVCIGRIAERLP